MRHKVISKSSLTLIFFATFCFPSFHVHSAAVKVIVCESCGELSLLKSVNFDMPFWCQRHGHITDKTLLRISALASKKRSNQKSSVRESN